MPWPNAFITVTCASDVAVPHTLSLKRAGNFCLIQALTFPPFGIHGLNGDSTPESCQLLSKL